MLTPFSSKPPPNASSFSLRLERMASSTPLRLSEKERVLLGVVEGALDHSEFTSNVDVSSSMHYVRETYDKDERVKDEVKELCRVLLGLSAANDFKSQGKDALGESFVDKEKFLARCLEVGRRFKIQNPDKMRDSYGKLVYVLMDAIKPSVQRALGFSLLLPVETVKVALERTNALEMLTDPALPVACGEIITSSEEAARRKLVATVHLCDKFAERLGSIDNVKRIIHSLEDGFSFLRSNRDPVDLMINYLQKHFHSAKEGNDFELSLTLQGRKCKPRHELNHDHSTQFVFVLQSLLLWREVMDQFFSLWLGAESDLLNVRNGYNLANTGQGMQRCQSAPATRANMDSILNIVKRNTDKTWVGLQVVHLGDREVPNALIFIDKYTQVPRILAPIVRCLQAVEGELSQKHASRKYIDETFGNPERCVKVILADLFRGGFDGGGDLGGSCIDGRLTSLWNWTSFIEKKPYYPVFLLSGFLGFDGKF